MLIGLFFIILGFLLMSGPSANTNFANKFDPNYFNKDIFSFRRIRLSPLLIIIGFIIEICSVLSNSKNHNKDR